MSKNNTVKRLTINYIYPHKFSILIALIMMIISAASTGLHAWLVRPALDDVLIKGDRQMLFLIPIAIIITTLCKGIATYLHSFQMSKVSHRIIANLQSEMFNKLMLFNLKFFSESKTGNLIWKFDLESSAPRRGMVYTKQDIKNPPRLFFSSYKKLISLNADSGKLIKTFGKNGFARLKRPSITALRCLERTAEYYNFTSLRMDRKELDLPNPLEYLYFLVVHNLPAQNGTLNRKC